MDATRTRLSFVADYAWDLLRGAAAAAAIALLAIGAALFVRELLVARAAAAAASPSANADAEVISVPTLVLAAGREIRVGEPEADALASVQAQTLVKRTEERGRFGARELRSYAGFTLLFEPFDRDGQPRVAAIYVQ